MTQDEMAGIAVRVVAEQTARKTIKELLRQRGVKLSYVPVREIVSQTHPEVTAEARAKAAELGYGPTVNDGR
jgi:hypothetical protein